MRVALSGASGFVGSNIAKVLVELAGDEVVDDRVDLADPVAVADHVEEAEADAVVHCAIVNDWDRLLADRHYGWQTYVGATRAYAAAAAERGIPFVLVSTDWVFDGTQGPADESTPPNPINLYGFLKAASELIATKHGGSVARVSGVNGTHWARPGAPRAQDEGFGYFVASLIDATSAGRTFTVWEADDINMVATPSLASMCGEVIRAVIDHPHPGVFHCCGSDSVSRRQLAERAIEVFDLDPSLIRFGSPPTPPPMPIPTDTSLDARSTAERLGTRLPDLTELLSAFRRERRTGTIEGLLGSPSPSNPARSDHGNDQSDHR